MADYIKRDDAIEYLVDNMVWMDADGIETSEECGVEIAYGGQNRKQVVKEDAHGLEYIQQERGIVQTEKGKTMRG